MEPFEKQQQMDSLIIQKEEEVERIRTIQQEHKDARKIFFTQQIVNKLRQVGANKKQKQSVVQVLMRGELRNNRKLLTQFIKKNDLSHLKHKIRQLQQAYDELENHYQQRQRKCPPIQQLISLKQSNLKIIRIQCETKINCYERMVPTYSVSAFELFLVIHNNKLLAQVTLKGVEVQQFQQFLQLVNPSNNGNKIENQRQKYSWISSLIPSKSLKVAINAKIQFDLKNKDQTSAKIEDLRVFRYIFYQVSDITVIIRLVKWELLSTSADLLQYLWESLKQIKSIQIELYFSRFTFPVFQIHMVRNLIFGSLASFTEITKLTFRYLFFSQELTINNYLAIQESLSTLFTNNAITYLKLQLCNKFPVIPETRTLQSIDICQTSFRRESNFMSQVIRTNNSLKSIISAVNQQNWKITESLFNQLESLIVRYCIFVQIQEYMSQSPSNIKQLRIYSRNVTSRSSWSQPLLSTLFPKLYYLTALLLQDVDIGHQIICMISSTSLKKLHISFNNKITDQGLRCIDLRWPYLRQLQILRCQNVTENAWNICSFKQLYLLKVDKEILQKSMCLIEYKRRGIKVYQ